MKPMVLYVPTNPGFPFVEFMCKTADGKELVVFQVRRQRGATKTFKWSSVNNFLEKVSAADKDGVLDLVRLVHIPMPSYADEAEMKPEDAVANLPPRVGTMSKYEVWKLPVTYDNTFDT